MRLTFIACTAAVVLGSAAVAEDINAPDELLTARHGYMLLLAQQLAPLGAMAKGELPFDATVATTAATSLAALASVDTSMLWVPGTEEGVLEDSSALPEVISNAADRTARFGELKAAADAMVEAAGTDAEAIKTAMTALGGACGGCHKQYRKSE